MVFSVSLRDKHIRKNMHSLPLLCPLSIVLFLGQNRVGEDRGAPRCSTFNAPSLFITIITCTVNV